MTEIEAEQKRVNVNAIFELIKGGKIGEIKHILQNGCRPSITDEGGATMLHVAASCGDPEICGLLLEYGLKPWQKDAFGWSPMMLARRDGRWDIVRLLRQR